jgi:hypothetical protein
MLDPVEVSFSEEGWDPTRTGSNIKLGAAEREGASAPAWRITQDQFARLLRGEQRLSRRHRGGSDVLRAKVAC